MSSSPRLEEMFAQALAPASGPSAVYPSCRKGSAVILTENLAGCPSVGAVGEVCHEPPNNSDRGFRLYTLSIGEETYRIPRHMFRPLSELELLATVAKTPKETVR